MDLVEIAALIQDIAPISMEVTGGDRDLSYKHLVNPSLQLSKKVPLLLANGRQYLHY